ncbi:MAG: aldolase/citrate lyase family protein [Chloroflexi bacterium]|nr:aldolase/citrate lyase family protein [Chloroflexota bacterium]MDA1271065.1 aldolase/citrate lyase family protein [Chloroflexota bacterium]
MTNNANLPGKIRRSWLLIPASQQDIAAVVAKSNADVVLLDLVEFVSEKDKPAAREGLAETVRGLRESGAEVFVQVDSELLYADIHACAWPELTGIVIAHLESAAQVEEADQLLGQLEDERGILTGSLEIVPALETAQANQDAYEIATASTRISGLTLGRAELVMDLRPEPSGEIHLMQYLMQRLVTVAGAAGVPAYGAWWREPDRGLMATPENTGQAASRGRAIGFKGSFCVFENQVDPMNNGFTPSPEEVAEARRLLEQCQAAVAAGATSLRQGDRIIDSGAAHQAQALIDRASVIELHDKAKADAKAGLPVPAP